jgi:hypothetical protein
LNAEKDILKTEGIKTIPHMPIEGMERLEVGILNRLCNPKPYPEAAMERASARVKS